MSWARRAGLLLGAAESGRGPDAKPIALLGRWRDIWSIYLSLSNNISKKSIFFRIRFEKVLLIICFHCKIKRPKQKLKSCFFSFSF